MEDSFYRGGGLSPREQRQRSFSAMVLVGGVILLAILFGENANYLNSPQVYVSNSTGKCVKVVSPKGERPCVPGDEDKYERVWVE